jgi:hypothetical protein
MASSEAGKMEEDKRDKEADGVAMDGADADEDDKVS